MGARISRRPVLAALLLLPLLHACVAPRPVATQTSPPPAYQPPVYRPPPAPIVYIDPDELSRYEADNRAAHAEVLALYNRASASGRISPAEAQQFTALQARLNRAIEQLNRGGLTPQECQDIASLLASDRKEVVLLMSQSGADAPRPVPTPHRPASNRPAPATPAPSRSAAAAPASVTLAPGEPAPRTEATIEGCVADNQRARDTVYATYRNGMRNGRIAAGEAQRFLSIEFRLNDLAAQNNRKGLTLAECQNLSQRIARERTAVDGMLQRQR